MNIMRRGTTLPAVALGLVLLPLGAAAQTLSPVQGSGGPMVVERVKSGVLIAPDFRIT